METFANIQEANQRIGELNAQLTIEKEARTAATTDLTAAKAEHQTAIESLKTQHGEELVKVRGEHATAITQLKDQVEAKDGEIKSLTSEVAKLKGEATTAADGAQKIVATIGGDAVPTEGDQNAGATTKTPEQIAELRAQQKKIKGPQAQYEFYLKHIKPFEG